MSDRRFLLFASPTFYPSGGAGDLVGGFESVDAAEGALSSPATAERLESGGGPGDAHVLDVETLTIVARWAQPHPGGPGEPWERDEDS